MNHPLRPRAEFKFRGVSNPHPQQLRATNCRTSVLHCLRLQPKARTRGMFLPAPVPTSPHTEHHTSYTSWPSDRRPVVASPAAHRNATRDKGRALSTGGRHAFKVCHQAAGWGKAGTSRDLEDEHGKAVVVGGRLEILPCQAGLPFSHSLTFVLPPAGHHRWKDVSKSLPPACLAIYGIFLFVWVFSPTSKMTHKCCIILPYTNCFP